MRTLNAKDIEKLENTSVASSTMAATLDTTEILDCAINSTCMHVSTCIGDSACGEISVACLQGTTCLVLSCGPETCAEQTLPCVINSKADGPADLGSDTAAIVHLLRAAIQ